MSDVIKNKILLDGIVNAWCTIIDRCEFPKFGSPVQDCDNCMFREVTCFPRPECVGCFIGWKIENEVYNTQ